MFYRDISVTNIEILIETDAKNTVYEHNADGNNLTTDDESIVVTIQPRPNLQVNEIISAGNRSMQGDHSLWSLRSSIKVPWPRPYPSGSIVFTCRSTTNVSSDDILISELDNGAALEPSESYRSLTGP